MTHYAEIDSRIASLSTEFGESFARRKFGDEFVDDLPVITRGPRKGKKRGSICWEKVVKGGWNPIKNGEGVEARGIRFVSIKSEHDGTGDVLAWWNKHADRCVCSECLDFRNNVYRSPERLAKERFEDYLGLFWNVERIAERFEETVELLSGSLDERKKAVNSAFARNHKKEWRDLIQISVIYGDKAEFEEFGKSSKWRNHPEFKLLRESVKKSAPSAKEDVILAAKAVAEFT